MSTHWASRERSEALDSERVKTFMATSRHLRKRVLPIFEDLQFRLAFRMLPVRSRFWFLKDSHPDIILCTQPSCGAVESDQHLFLECDHTAQLWREILPTWDQFFHLDHVGLLLHVQLCHHFGRIGRSISKLYQIYGLHYKRWLCTSSGPIGIVVCSISDQQLRQFQHFPWYTLRLVPTFGTFEDSVTIIYERIRLAKMLDQLATQGSFVGFFRSRRSLLRVRHRQVELQVQLGS